MGKEVIFDSGEVVHAKDNNNGWSNIFDSTDINWCMSTKIILK